MAAQQVGKFQQMISDSNRSGGRSENRKATDRRRLEAYWPNDRRVRPDRRLNNISVEWIPFAEIKRHPLINETLGGHRTKVIASGTCRENQRRNTTVESEHSMVGIFPNKRYPDLDLRKGPDRRTRDQTPPYDRRTQPDRRLSAIEAEWITEDVN